MTSSALQILQHLRLCHSMTQALTRFSISRKSREEMVHFFLSRAGELNFHFSRCSRMSRFWRKNSCSPLEIRDFEKKSLSLLERMRFCKQILFSRVKILREKTQFLLSILPSISLPILVIFCYLVGFWPAVFCRKRKYSKKTVLCCWAIF